jgi:hypothetical protein
MRTYALLWLVLVAGCPPANPIGVSGPGQGQGQAQPQGQAGGGGSCAAILGCMSACNSDQGCINGCYERGDAQGQQTAAALITCSNNCNSESACIDAQCATEVAACRGGGDVAQAEPSGGGGGGGAAPAAMLPGQPHSTENLLPWLTGQWITNVHQFEFYGDGRVRRATGSATYTETKRVGCTYVTNENGTVTQDGDMLVFRFGRSALNNCGTNVGAEGQDKIVRYKIEWVDNQYDNDPNLQLQLRNLDCDSDGAFQCVEGMTRR